MGYDATSYAVYGKKVTKDSLTVNTQVRACNHQTDLSKKFCAECGKPVYKTEKQFLADEGYEEGKIGYFTKNADSQEEGILGFVLAKTSSNRSSYDDSGFFKISTPTPEMTEQLKSFFEKHNLKFDIKDFKMYLYTYESY